MDEPEKPPSAQHSPTPDFLSSSGSTGIYPMWCAWRPLAGFDRGTGLEKLLINEIAKRLRGSEEYGFEVPEQRGHSTAVQASGQGLRGAGALGDSTQGVAGRGPLASRRGSDVTVSGCSTHSSTRASPAPIRLSSGRSADGKTIDDERSVAS